MSVQVKRVFIMSITKISNRRLPSGDKIINKRRFSPLVCVPLSGWCVKPDVGAFNRRQHMEVTTNAGEWVRANDYYHNHGTEDLELAILVAALGRRQST